MVITLHFFLGSRMRHGPDEMSPTSIRATALISPTELRSLRPGRLSLLAGLAHGLKFLGHAIHSKFLLLEHPPSATRSDWSELQK
jgi:hypothetical protein